MSGSMRELSLENNGDMTGMIHDISDRHSKAGPNLFLLDLAHTGTMPVMMLVLLIEGKVNMEGCEGTLSLPSRADIDSAPKMVTERLTAINTVDLRKYEIGFYVEGQVTHKNSKFTYTPCASHLWLL